MHKSRFEFVRQLQVAYAIPELRQNVALRVLYQVVWVALVPLSFLIRLPCLIFGLVAVVSNYFESLLDFSTPSSYFRDKAHDQVSKAHQIMTPRDIRKKLGWDQEDAVILPRG